MGSGVGMDSVDLFAETDGGSLCAAANLCSERGREKFFPVKYRIYLC